MNQLDDHAARELLSPLAGEPDGPQRLDLAEIERAGGRRRRRNRHLAAGGLTALVLAAGCGTFLALQPGSGVDNPVAGYGSPSPGASTWPGPAITPPAGMAPAPVGAKCVATQLSGPTGQVYAVDRTGHYAVEIRGTQGSYSAVVFKDGQQTRTITLPSSARVEVSVNATGELALTLSDNQKNPVPYAYADGKLTKLKGGGIVADIADDGRIGGISGTKPVIWATPDAPPTHLALPAGDVHGFVIGFDTDGTILSTAQNSDNTRTTALLWRKGGSGAQTVKLSPAYADGLSVDGIRDGKVVASGAGNVYFSYDVTTRKVTKLPAQAYGLQGVGGGGTVVGAPTGSVPMWAVVGGTAHELATLHGITSYSIVRVADDGHTVFGNSWQGSKALPTRWTCPS